MWHSARAKLSLTRRVAQNAQDDVTPLHHACYKGSVECVRTLLEHGANREAKTQNVRALSSWAGG